MSALDSLAMAGARMSSSSDNTNATSDESGMEIMRAEVINEEDWLAAEKSSEANSTNQG